MAAREFELEIAALSGTLRSIEKVIDLPKLRIEAKELEEAAGVPNLWDDPEAAQKLQANSLGYRAKLIASHHSVKDLMICRYSLN